MELRDASSALGFNPAIAHGIVGSSYNNRLMAEVSLAKILILSVFLLILVSLGTAAFKLFRGNDRNGTATVKALTVRVLLSILLVFVILVLNKLGVLSPHG